MPLWSGEEGVPDEATFPGQSRDTWEASCVSHMSISRWLIQLFHKKIESSLQTALNGKVGGAPVRAGGVLPVYTLHTSLGTSSLTRLPAVLLALGTHTPALETRRVYFSEESSAREERVTAHATAHRHVGTDYLCSSPAFAPAKQLSSSPHQPSLLLALWSPSPTPTHSEPPSWCSPPERCATVEAATLFSEAGTGMNGRHWPVLQTCLHPNSPSPTQLLQQRKGPSLG